MNIITVKSEQWKIITSVDNKFRKRKQKLLYVGNINE